MSSRLPSPYCTDKPQHSEPAPNIKLETWDSNTTSESLGIDSEGPSIESQTTAKTVKNSKPHIMCAKETANEGNIPTTTTGSVGGYVSESTALMSISKPSLSSSASDAISPVHSSYSGTSTVSSGYVSESVVSNKPV